MQDFVIQAVEKEVATRQRGLPPRRDYAARLEEFAKRVSEAPPGEATLSAELRRMRDR